MSHLYPRRRSVAAVSAAAVTIAVTAIAFAYGQTPSRARVASSQGHRPSAHAPEGAALAKAFPILADRRARVADRAQLAAIEAIIAHARSMAPIPGTDPTGGANAALARIGFDSLDDTIYLVPGSTRICEVEIRPGAGDSLSCGEMAAKERAGFFGYGATPGGWEVDGVLPAGSGNVSVTDSAGRTTTARSSSGGGFSISDTAPLAEARYTTPATGPRVVAIGIPAAPTPAG
jgi:hypothetical protein